MAASAKLRGENGSCLILTIYLYLSYSFIRSSFSVSFFFSMIS